MTRYYVPNCLGGRGWHHGLRRALWCHAIMNPTVHPLDVIHAKDPGEPKRQLTEWERDEITDIISATPWRLTPQEIRNVIARTEKPPWS